MVEKIKKEIKRIDRYSKKTKVVAITVLAILLVLSPFITGFIKGFIKEYKISKAPQGQLIFQIVREEDFKEEGIKEWIDKNRYEKGVYSINDNGYKYILLAAGELKDDVDMKITSVEGFKDKIMINGDVTPIINNSESKRLYRPYLVLKIEEDPRNVVLGSLNLFNVYENKNSDKKIRNVGLDVGIIEKTENELITIMLLKGDNPLARFKLSEELKKEINIDKLKKNQLVGIHYRGRINDEIPIITKLKPTSKVVARLKKEKIIDFKENMIDVSVNDYVKRLKYSEKIEGKLKDIITKEEMVATITYRNSFVYIDDVIHSNSIIIKNNKSNENIKGGKVDEDKKAIQEDDGNTSSTTND